MGGWKSFRKFFDKVDKKLNLSKTGRKVIDTYAASQGIPLEEFRGSGGSDEFDRVAAGSPGVAGCGGTLLMLITVAGGLLCVIGVLM